MGRVVALEKEEVEKALAEYVARKSGAEEADWRVRYIAAGGQLDLVIMEERTGLMARERPIDNARETS